MFSADPGRWGRGDQPLASAMAAGTFRIGPQRGGEYLLAVIKADEPAPDPSDRDSLSRLSETAERIALLDEEENTITLSIRR
jgi:hypothetical protein